MDARAGRTYRRSPTTTEEITMSNATRIVATAATALALATPVAGATPAKDAPNHNSPGSIAAPAAQPTTAASPSGSFDWGDAAIGAGGVLGLIVLFSAGAAVTGRVRTVPTR
jgi:hypothetical protein